MRRVLVVWLALSVVGLLNVVALSLPGGRHGESLAPDAPNVRTAALPAADDVAPSGLNVVHATDETHAARSTAAQTVAGSGTAGISADALDLLAHAVYGEARGEPYAGQVAVAAVILNRMEDPRFPDTVAGVVYEPGAFTAVADKQIYLSPDETAYAAARDAVNGADPTGGAVYYYNPARTTNNWIWSRPVVTVIGRHWFAH